MDLRDGPVHAKPEVNEELAAVLEEQGWVRDRDFTVSPGGCAATAVAPNQVAVHCENDV